METELIKTRFELVAPVLDEKRLRLYVAAEAMTFGYGGISAVSRATGVSRPTITAGCKELSDAKKVKPSRGISSNGTNILSLMK